MRRATLLLVPLFLFACDREPVAPDITPTLDIANAPEESGIVVRYGTALGFNLGDPAADLVAFMGWDIVNWCAGDNPGYGAQVRAEKEIMEGYRSVMLGTAADLKTSVWRLSEIAAATWSAICAKIAATEPLATGFSSAVYTDNAFVGYDYVTNANPYGWRYHGLLVRPDGTGASFSGHHFWMWDQENGVAIVRSRKMTLK
jgi:hypothetical protein